MLYCASLTHSGIARSFPVGSLGVAFCGEGEGGGTSFTLSMCFILSMIFLWGGGGEGILGHCECGCLYVFNLQERLWRYHVILD